MKTTKSLKASECHADWYVIDATDIVLGRLAAYAAILLRGKHKPTFTPHMDCGDHVIIINAEKIALTGNKADKTKFFWHTGWVGGIKERTFGKMREEKPEQFVFNAVKRMMGRRTSVALANKRLTKLHVFKGPQHTHSAQKPVAVDFGAMNPKNKRA
jgi:large subunit ribosomal protein L13